MNKGKVILGKNCLVDKKAEIGRQSSKQKDKKNLFIGDNCLIRSGSVLYLGSTIGRNFQTGHNVIIREDNLIGNNVSVGSYTELGLRNRIGSNSRIHTGCFLEDVTLGKNVFIGPHVTFTNDPHPPTAFICPEFESCIKGAEVSDGAVIGGNATILPHVKIGKHSLVGAGSVVTKDVPDHAVAVGNPAKVIKKVTDIVCLKGKKGHKPYEEYLKLQKK